MLRTIALLLSFSIVSCGGNSGGSGSDAPKNPPPDNGNDGQDGGNGDDSNPKNPSDPGTTGSWYGLVTKCLVDAEEATVSTFITVKQKVACSPVMSGKDMNEVNGKLNLWKKDNCPERVDIRNGTVGNYSGCYITPFGAQNAVGNDKASIEAKSSDVELCDGKHGANYGSIRCN